MIASGRVILGLWILSGAAAAQGFGVLDLDGNGVLDQAVAFDISETGLVVGAGHPIGSATGHGVLWHDGQSFPLPLLPDHEVAQALGVDDLGRVVGSSADVVPFGDLLHIYEEAVMWDGGAAIRLRDLVKSGDSPHLLLQVATDISRNGLVTIYGFDPDDLQSDAFLLDLNTGHLTRIPSLSSNPAALTTAWAVNDRGQIAGYSDSTSPLSPHAVLWEDGVYTDLHVLGGAAGVTSRAFDINNRGQVCGSAALLPGWSLETAVVWDGGQMEVIGALAGVESYAYGINDHGHVVGRSDIGNAFLWRDGVLQDLNDLIPPGLHWQLESAFDISNDGRIVGEGFLDTQLTACLLTPDCFGGFEIEGIGCPSSDGFVPELWGAGCPTGGGNADLAVTLAPAGSLGVLLFGLGSDTTTVGGCRLQIQPLAGPILAFPLGGVGPGAGGLQLHTTLPPSVPALDVHMQMFTIEAGPSGARSATNPLVMHFQ